MKTAVIDIGTRATRLLIGDTDALRSNGFRFEDYINRGELTEGGLGIALDANGVRYMRVKHLDATLAALRSYLDECASRGVPQCNIHVVGTELFRRISNWQDVLAILDHAVHPARVVVLDPLEEAECTFWSAMVSCGKYYKVSDPMIVVEQGGGSIQITMATVGQSGKPVRHKQASVPQLGTLLLRQEFLERDGGSQKLGTVYQDVCAYADSVVIGELSDLSAVDLPRPTNMFALGSVITEFAGYKAGGVFRSMSSRRIHGRLITLSQLEEFPNLVRTIVEKYADRSILSLLEDIEAKRIEPPVEGVEGVLQALYGLPCYAAVMRFFDLDSLRVCGTGMRYGVFFRLAHDEWKDVREFQRPA